MHLKEFENFNYKQFLQLKSDLMNKNIPPTDDGSISGSGTDSPTKSKKDTTQNSLKTSIKKENEFEKNTRTAFENFYSDNIISPVDHEHIKNRKFSCVRLILKMTPEHEDFFNPPNDENKHYLITDNENTTSFMNFKITYKLKTKFLVKVLMTSNSNSNSINENGLINLKDNQKVLRTSFGFYICTMEIGNELFLYFKSSENKLVKRKIFTPFSNNEKNEYHLETLPIDINLISVFKDKVELYKTNEDNCDDKEIIDDGYLSPEKIFKWNGFCFLLEIDTPQLEIDGFYQVFSVSGISLQPLLNNKNVFNLLGNKIRTNLTKDEYIYISCKERQKNNKFENDLSQFQSNIDGLLNLLKGNITCILLVLNKEFNNQEEECTKFQKEFNKFFTIPYDNDKRINFVCLVLKEEQWFSNEIMISGAELSPEQNVILDLISLLNDHKIPIPEKITKKPAYQKMTKYYNENKKNNSNSEDKITGSTTEEESDKKNKEEY